MQYQYDNRTDEEIEFDECLEDAYWEREDEKNADDYMDDVFFESDFGMYVALWEDTVDTRKRLREGAN